MKQCDRGAAFDKRAGRIVSSKLINVQAQNKAVQGCIMFSKRINAHARLLDIRVSIILIRSSWINCLVWIFVKWTAVVLKSLYLSHRTLEMSRVTYITTKIYKH